MPILYTLNSDEVPAFMVPSGLLDPYAAGGPQVAVSETINNGETGTGVDKLNRQSSRLDNLGRYGGGGYAVPHDHLDLLDGGGLTLKVARASDPTKGGVALIDGPVVFPTAKTTALPDNINGSDPEDWVRVWITRTGDLVLKQDLTQPASAAAFLGQVQTTGGAISAVDYSGRLEIRGRNLYRRTADVGEPADTPAADIGFTARTAGGLYWWDGVSWETAGDGYSVYADPSDTVPGTLEDKTKAGAGIGLAVVVDGGIRKLEITNEDPGSDVATDLAAHIAADPLDHPDGSVTEAKLADAAVTTDKIADLSVTEGKLAFDAATQAELDAVEAEFLEHVETFTLNVDVPVGEDWVWQVDFSNRGSYAGRYEIWLNIDQDDETTLVFATENHRSGTTFEFLVQSAIDNATAGTYGDETQIQISVRLQGPGWTAGAGGAPTLSPGAQFNAGSGSVGALAKLWEGYIADASGIPTASDSLGNEGAAGDVAWSDVMPADGVVTKITLHGNGDLGGVGDSLTGKVYVNEADSGESLVWSMTAGTDKIKVGTVNAAFSEGDLVDGRMRRGGTLAAQRVKMTLWGHF